MADIVPYGLFVGEASPDAWFTPLRPTPDRALSSSIEGSIGFRYEGGVITVDAFTGEVVVDFDRPMVYDSSHTHTGGTPYDIGTPTLSADSRSLAIPIVVPPAPAPEVSSVVVSDSEVVVNFTEPVQANGTVSNSGAVLSLGDMVGAGDSLSFTLPVTLFHPEPGENMRYIVEFGADATGLTPVFDKFVRMDTLQPIAPAPTFTEIDTTGSFYFDFVRVAGDPDVYFEATAGGVTVKGLMSPLDNGTDFGTIPADLAAIKARTDNLPANTAQELSDIAKKLTNALGLLHENAVLDKTTYESGTNNLLTGRIRIYDTEANATMARNQSELNLEYDTGKLAQYAIVGRYLGDNMVNYLTVKTWEAP